MNIEQASWSVPLTDSLSSALNQIPQDTFTSLTNQTTRQPTRPIALCGLRGCKNRIHSVSWPEVIKGVPNQGLDCFVSYGSFFCFSFVFLVYAVLCLIVFGCQYQCNWLPGKTRLRNDLLCVEWNVIPYTLTHLSINNNNKAFTDIRLCPGALYCVTLSPLQFYARPHAPLAICDVIRKTGST